MPVFEYKGLTSGGKEVKGLIDADNPAGVRSKLKRDGIYLTDVRLGKEKKTSKEISFKQRIGAQDIALMTRQLSTLISAGIPIVESLSALTDQVENLKLKSTLSIIKDRVNEGSALADALREHPKIFSNLYMNMIRAGEASGTLHIVLERLADFSEGQVKLKNKIVSVLAYPAIMFLVSIGVLVFLFTYLIPTIMKIYDNIDTALPLPTEILIGMSTLVTKYWILIIIFVGAVYFIFRSYIGRPKGRKKFDRFKLKLPVVGEMVRMVAVSRFASTFSTLLSSGVPVLTAMEIVKNVVNNSIFAEVIEAARSNISEGQSVAEPLRRSNEFPPMVTHMIAIGEKTGELEAMLAKISETFENSFETRIATLTSIMEPIMILIMAGIIGFIVVALMLPLIQLSSTI